MTAGAEPDSADLAALQKQFGSAGTLDKDQERVLGVNYYPLGKTLKLATDFGLLWQSKEGVNDTPTDLRSRVLVKFYF